MPPFVSALKGINSSRLPSGREDQEEKEPEEEDELLLCEEPESSKEPEGELEELEGEKKLEPLLPKLNEEERELEYQQMIDKLNITLSAALARGERRRR